MKLLPLEKSHEQEIWFVVTDKYATYQLIEITWLSWHNIAAKWSKWKIVIQTCCRLDLHWFCFWPCSKCSIKCLSKVFSSGSQVDWSSGWPSHLTLYCILPFLLRFLRILSASNIDWLSITTLSSSNCWLVLSRALVNVMANMHSGSQQWHSYLWHGCLTR